MSVVALVGNGLSIAYNQELSVHSLTLEVLDRVKNADNELRAIAAEAGQGNAPGFEELLGPFDAVSAMIRNLPGIRSGEGWAPRFDALRVALEAALEIHSHGTGLALSVIAERSQIEGDFQPMDGFCSAIAEVDDPANLTIAALNYGGLMTAGFLQEGIYPDWTVRRTLYSQMRWLVTSGSSGRHEGRWDLV